MHKQHTQKLFLFFLICVSFIAQLQFSNAISPNLKFGNAISYEDMEIELSLNDGILENETERINRLARITFDKYQSGFDIFNDSECSNLTIIDCIDYTEESEMFLNKLMYVPYSELLEVGGSSGSIDRDSYFAYSIVFNPSIETYPSNYSLFSIRQIYGERWIPYFYHGLYYELIFDSDNDMLQWYVKYDYILNETTLVWRYDWYEFNLSKPVFFAFECMDEYNTIRFGNVDSNISTFEFYIDDPSDNEYVQTIVSYNNIGQNLFGGIFAIDFYNDLWYNNEGIKFGVDETYYSERILETYLMNDESYNIYSNEKFSSLNLTTVENFEINSVNNYVLSNTTDSLDYKLDSSGNAKEGVIQWGDYENPDYSDITIIEPDNTDVYVIEKWGERENVMYCYDNSNVGQIRISHIFGSITSGTIEFYYWVPNSASIGYIYLYLGSSNRVYLYTQNNNLYYWNGSANLITTLYDENWYYFNLKFDGSLFNLSIIDKYESYSYFNNLNYNTAGNIDRILFGSSTSQFNYYFCYDSISVSNLNGYKEKSIKWIGSQNVTKTVECLQLDNSTDETFDYIDLNVYDNISYQVAYSLYGLVGLQITDNNPYSALYCIANPYGLDSSGEFGISLIDKNGKQNQWRMAINNGTMGLYVQCYDYYSETYYSYYSLNNYQFFNESEIDSRIGFIIQKNVSFGYSLTYFNSSFYNTVYFDHRLIFSTAYINEEEELGVSQIKFLVRNYASTKNAKGIEVYGLNYIENNTKAWNLRMIASLLQQKYVETYQIYEDTLTINVPDVFDELNIGYYYISRMESWFGVSDEILYDFYLKNYFEFNFTANNYLLGYFNTTNSTELIVSGLNPYILKDLLIDIGVNASMYGEMNTNITVSLGFEFVWRFYYDSESENIINKMISIGTPLMIFLMFPFAIYKKFGIKGAIVGLIGGTIILVISEMLALIYAVIIIPISIIIAVLIYKERRVID